MGDEQRKQAHVVEFDIFGARVVVAVDAVHCEEGRGRPRESEGLDAASLMSEVGGVGINRLVGESDTTFLEHLALNSLDEGLTGLDIAARQGPHVACWVLCALDEEDLKLAIKLAQAARCHCHHRTRREHPLLLPALCLWLLYRLPRCCLGGPRH